MLKESGVATRPSLKKQVLGGLTLVKVALFKIYNLFIKDLVRPFSTINEALGWLIKE